MYTADTAAIQRLLCTGTLGPSVRRIERREVTAREQRAMDTRERLVIEGPLSVDETRRRIAARGCDFCDFAGFYVAGRDVFRLEVCGCCEDDLTDLQRVYRDDVEQLPEAIAKLASVRRAVAADDERAGR